MWHACGAQWQQVACLWRPMATSGMLVAPNGNKWHACGAQWQQVAHGGSAIAFRFAPRGPNYTGESF
jgi:hypothetical protein